MENDKKKIQVEVVRKDGKTLFRFKIDKRIEAMYQKDEPEIKDSQNWKGLKFYSLPSLTQDAKYQNELRRLRLFDNFGDAIYDDGRRYLNIAWLRTVGGEGEVEIPSEIGFAELSELIRNALDFIKNYFDDYYREFTIKGNVSVEI